MNTPKLNLGTIASGQAGGEIIYNESMAVLDAFVQPVVVSMSVTAQPGSPTVGDTYVLPSTPTGAQWAGNGNKIARFVNSAWQFYVPFEGLQLYNLADDTHYTYNGSTWGATVAAALPSQGGNAGKMLMTNGTSLLWRERKFNQGITGTQDGVNNSFTFGGSDTILTGSLALYRGGIRQQPGTDFTVNYSTKALTFSPVLEASELVLLDYTA